MVYDFNIKAYEQSALFAVYFALALYGLFQWKMDEVSGSKEKTQ
jgi:nicotinamide riboside transporter PnuC